MKIRQFTQRLFDVFFFLALVAYILAGTSSVPFHGDESTLIFMSRDYAYQFLQDDLTLVTYHDPPISATEQQLRLLNGTLGKYLIGFAWHLGGFSINDLNQQWDWGGDWNYNQQHGHAPSDALLQVSRIPSAVLLAAGVIVIFALGSTLGGRPVAYLASLYYALNPALLIDGRRAIMEGNLTTCSLLAVLAGIWLLQKRRWWTAILLGAAAGLALASKHTAAFTLVAVFGACAAYPIVTWIAAKWRHAQDTKTRPAALLKFYLLLVVSSVLALGIFYALNPAWWGDPITRAAQVLVMRNDLLVGQTAAFGGYANLPDVLGGFFRQVFINLPQYYEVPTWASYIADPIARYESSPWHGISLGGSLVGGMILLALMLVGFVALVLNRSANGAARWLIGLWALAMLAATALLTPIEWQRYYLPAYPVVGLLAALGLVWLIRRFRARYSNRYSDATALAS